MSPHQSKTGVYVFFAFRAKLIHVFVFAFSLLSLVASLSLSFFLSLLNLSLFPLSLFSLSSSPAAVLTIVSRASPPANLCRRRSVAFCLHFHPWQGPIQKRGEMHTRTHPESPHATQYWEHRRRWPQDGAKRCTFHCSLAAVGDFFEWDARACLECGLRAWDVAQWWRITGSVLIWGFSPRLCHVDRRCRCPLEMSIRYRWNPLSSLQLHPNCHPQRSATAAPKHQRRQQEQTNMLIVSITTILALLTKTTKIY